MNRLSAVGWTPLQRNFYTHAPIQHENNRALEKSPRPPCHVERKCQSGPPIRRTRPVASSDRDIASSDRDISYCFCIRDWMFLLRFRYGETSERRHAEASGEGGFGVCCPQPQPATLNLLAIKPLTSLARRLVMSTCHAKPLATAEACRDGSLKQRRLTSDFLIAF